MRSFSIFVFFIIEPNLQWGSYCHFFILYQNSPLLFTTHDFCVCVFNVFYLLMNSNKYVVSILNYLLFILADAFRQTFYSLDVWHKSKGIRKSQSVKCEFNLEFILY